MWWILVALVVFGFVLLAGGAVAFLVFRRKPAVDEDFERDFGGAEPQRDPGTPAEPLPALQQTLAPEDQPSPKRTMQPSPTIVAPSGFMDDAPAPEPSVAPEPVAPPAPEPDHAPEPPVLEHLQKFRVADTELVLRAYAAHFPGEELLAFVSEGGDARPDLVLYLRPDGDRDQIVKAGLKFFSFVALKLGIDGIDPAPGRLLPYPGHIGGLHFSGFLVVDPCEPVKIPLERRLVLLAVPRALAGREPADIAQELGVAGAFAPYLSLPDAG